MINVDKIWKSIIDKVENGYKASSEKTLVFLIAMAFNEELKENRCQIDFEVQVYDELKDTENKYLDIFIKYFEKDVERKIGIEVKFPSKNSNGNSNQTETRVKIYRDFVRLIYLKEKKNIDEGYFFMATDELPYINKGNKSEKLIYLTSHNFTTSSLTWDSENQFKYKIEDVYNLKFEWEYIKEKDNKYTIANGNTYAWLKPIKIEEGMENYSESK